MIHAMPNLLWIDVPFSFDPHLQLHIDNWTSSIASVLFISQARSVCEIPFFYIFSWPCKAPWKRVFFFSFRCFFLGRRFSSKPGDQNGQHKRGCWKWWYFHQDGMIWYVSLLLSDIHWFCMILSPWGLCQVFFLGYEVTSEWPTLLETSS